MSFRRDKQKALQWKTWLQKHRPSLVAAGVPQVVLDDISHWYYFLEHGYYTLPGSAEPMIDVNRRNEEEAERLCSFPEQDDFYPLSLALNRLQYLLKRGHHSKERV